MSEVLFSFRIKFCLDISRMIDLHQHRSSQTCLQNRCQHRFVKYYLKSIVHCTKNDELRKSCQWLSSATFWIIPRWFGFDCLFASSCKKSLFNWNNDISSTSSYSLDALSFHFNFGCLSAYSYEYVITSLVERYLVDPLKYGTTLSLKSSHWPWFTFVVQLDFHWFCFVAIGKKKSWWGHGSIDVENVGIRKCRWKMDSRKKDGHHLILFWLSIPTAK